MKAADLRIGNWISDIHASETGMWQITQLRDKLCFYGGFFSKYEALTPIPLTPEILEKCGFELLPGSKNVFRIIINELEISVNTKLSFAYIDTVWGQASIKNPIFEYLHQVQNLVYSLTGTELNYTPSQA